MTLDCRLVGSNAKLLPLDNVLMALLQCECVTRWMKDNIIIHGELIKMTFTSITHHETSTGLLHTMYHISIITNFVFISILNCSHVHGATKTQRSLVITTALVRCRVLKSFLYIKMLKYSIVIDNKLCAWRHNMPPPLSSPHGRPSASRATEQTQRSSTFPCRICSHNDHCSCLMC